MYIYDSKLQYLNELDNMNNLKIKSGPYFTGQYITGPPDYKLPNPNLPKQQVFIYIGIAIFIILII